MSTFRSVMEVLKWTHFPDILCRTACISSMWKRASDCNELWDVVSESLNLPPREEGKSAKEWCKLCTSTLYLPLLSSGTGTVYSIPSLAPRDFSFDRETKINEMTCYCFVRPTTLLCCGGSCENNVYEVNVYSGKVSEKSPMLKPRNWGGILKVDNWVYVLGGATMDSYEPTSEKYNIEENKWVFLCGQFQEPRNGFVPVRVQSKVYCIGRWSSCEILDLNTEQFTFLNLPMLKYDYWTLSLLHNDLLLVTQFDDFFVLSMGFELLGKEKTMRTRGPWSNCPPVVYQNCAYTVLNPNPAEGLLQVDLVTHKITKHSLR